MNVLENKTEKDYQHKTLYNYIGTLVPSVCILFTNCVVNTITFAS